MYTNTTHVCIHIHTCIKTCKLTKNIYQCNSFNNKYQTRSKKKQQKTHTQTNRTKITNID